MSVEVIKCPACGGSLDVDGKTEFFKCGHCGNTLRLKITGRPAQPSVMKFVDKSLNIPLASCGLPDTYTPSGSLMPNSASYTYPMPIRCAAANKFGTAFSFFTGEAYTDDTKCPMLSGPYATVVNQISKTHFRPLASRTVLENTVFLFKPHSLRYFVWQPQHCLSNMYT